LPTTDDDTPPELRTIVVTPVGGGWRERALEAEAENAALHERLAAADRLNASLSEWGNRGWARVAELASEIEALKASRHKAGRKRKPDDELADRTLRERQQEAIKRAEAEAREARLAPVAPVRHKFCIVLAFDDE
jgi:uncharacterized protein YaiL (DUF2058 family)